MASKNQETTKPSTALAVGFAVWTPEAAEAEAAVAQAAKSGDELKPIEGLNYWRIFPPIAPRKTAFAVMWQHFYKREDGEGWVVHNCPKKNGVRAFCESCSNAEPLMASANKADKDVGYKMSAKRVAYANAVNCAVDGDGLLLDSKVRILQVSPRQKSEGPYELILGLMTGDGLDVTHPVTGSIICVEKKTIGKMEVNYKLIRKKFKEMPLWDLNGGEHTLKEWAEMTHDLGKLKCYIPTDEEISALIAGEDEDEKPARRASATRPAQPRGRSAQDDIEDGDEDDGDANADLSD